MVNYDFEESSAGNLYNNISFDTGCSNLSYMNSNWAHIAESTMPLSTPKYANRPQFQASVRVLSRDISSKVIVVNLVSMLVNMLLAIVAFYFAFARDSPSTTAFAADCALDWFSSAIVLWRFYGDLESVYLHAREQIACIYLGALFEISALAIIIKALSDVVSGSDFISDEKLDGQSYELVYLAIAGSIVCCITMVVKINLYYTIRDKSILLDVINALISTVFALSIVLSQLLINVYPQVWYIDAIFSIFMGLFMAGFGLKVIHENFEILKAPQNLNNLAFNDSYQTMIPINHLIARKDQVNRANHASYGSTY